MHKYARILVAVVVLLSGTALIPYVAFPSEQFNWRMFAGAYIYEPVADLAVTKIGSVER